MAVNPLFLIDFYKAGHVSQYPSGITQVFSNWTARSSRVKDCDGVICFGHQAFLQRLDAMWRDQFFDRPWHEVRDQYEELIRTTLGVQEPKIDHIRDLHGEDRLPVRIYALPEGFRVPLGVPSLVITNTLPEFFWLPNYLETHLSNSLWKPYTSATTARRFRKLFEKYARQFGEKDLGFVDWQGHDFSYRGMSGLDDAILSGMGHLLSFSGTDTVPAILAAREYYDAPLSVGGSVPATEHSVMCAGGQDNEFETFKRLITETYPSGILSIVSDTWDLWKVLTDYVPRLKEVILKRDGKVVIRPDSGDPVKIIDGDSDAPPDSPARQGALALLAKAMGTDGQGHINKAGLIYGDGISLERAEAILAGAVSQRLSPFNIVFGIGSYTYEFVTRDTYNFAMKATAVRRGTQVEAIFKKPITDDFHKASLSGIPIVTGEPGSYKVHTTLDPEELDRCAFRKIYEDGRLLVHSDFQTIRNRARQ